MANIVVDVMRKQAKNSEPRAKRLEKEKQLMKIGKRMTNSINSFCN